MKNIILQGLFAVIAMAAAGTQANATITAIASDLCPNPACLPSAVQPVVRGVGSNRVSTMTVKGHFVDLSTAVEVTGSGVTVSYGDRAHGSQSSIVIRFTVSPSADLGERTVRMRYAIETNGPDTFKIRVVRGGNVTEIKRKVVSGNRQTGTSTSYVDPTSIPLGSPIILRFRGTNIGNATLKVPGGVTNVQKLSGCTETECEIQMTFTQSGSRDLHLFDGSAGNLQIKPLAFKFYYAGVSAVTASGTPSGSTGTFITPIVGSVGGTPTTFVDVAPKAFIANVFRRNAANSFTDSTGRQFFGVLSTFSNLCSGMSGDASRIVTIPNPAWGVSNVGTANVTTDFQIQLKSGANVLDTRTVTTDLLAGGSRDFTFDRPGDSQVRLFTFLIRGGCFMSPQADKFFEDSAFSVSVDTTGALTESNESNNTRNF